MIRVLVVVVDGVVDLHLVFLAKFELESNNNRGEDRRLVKKLSCALR